MNDLNHARRLANKLKNDKSFYELQSEVAKNNFNTFFGEKEYIYKMSDLFQRVINE